MVCNYNTTNISQTDGGSIVKQGDTASSFGFSLLDENYQFIHSLEGAEATIRLTSGKSQWKKQVKVLNGAVSFTINSVLPVGNYRLEISANGYVFPSDTLAKITVVASDRELVTDEVHSLKELDIAEEVKKQLAKLPVGEGGVVQVEELPDLITYYNLGKV